MNKMRHIISLVGVVGLISGLSACMPPLVKEDVAAKPVAEVKKAEEPVVAITSEPMATLPVRPVVGPERIALDDGIRLYGEGNYNAAIKRLGGAAEIWKADKSIQVEALKYMAFSYCVSGRQALCRQQFDKALRIDRTFDLAPGEKGHPLWGPVFARSKKNK